MKKKEIYLIAIIFCSGAEDMHAYLWDRYYGMCLAKYKHMDVVNSVAFNPKDSEMLVTTGDDFKIKVSLFETFSMKIFKKNVSY